MNSYELHRIFFDWCFENPEKVTPNHVAVYTFAVEHCNRLGWKEKFGFPTEMAKDAIGIKSYKTYIATLMDLVDWGFIKMIERSRNQYSSNIVALVKNTKALTKALAKASSKHVSKQVQPTGESNSTIDKPVTNKLRTIKQFNAPSMDEVINYFTQNGYSEAYGIQVWRYYNEGDWKDSKGDQVLNWKQKIRGNWFKEDKKVSSNGNRVTL